MDTTGQAIQIIADAGYAEGREIVHLLTDAGLLITDDIRNIQLTGMHTPAFAHTDTADYDQVHTVGEAIDAHLGITRDDDYYDERAIQRVTVILDPSVDPSAFDDPTIPTIDGSDFTSGGATTP